nr:OB-fold domain-containing protein [Sphingomonas sp. Y57]
MIARPFPVPDKDSAPYWEGLEAGELRVQRCAGCGTLRWPARAICNRCHSFDADWVAMSGRGTIKSWIRTHQRFHPAFAGEIPYVTLLVALAEQADIQIIGAFADPAAEPKIGEAVHAVFRGNREDGPILFWELGAS